MEKRSCLRGMHNAADLWLTNNLSLSRVLVCIRFRTYTSKEKLLILFITDFSKCLAVREVPNDGSHFWWHPLLPIDMRVVKGVKLAMEVLPDPHFEISPAIELDPTIVKDDVLKEVDILHALHNDVEQRSVDVVLTMRAFLKLRMLSVVLRMSWTRKWTTSRKPKLSTGMTYLM